MQSVVIGATGVVGSFIRQKLIESGERPYGLSRHYQQGIDGTIWIRGDLSSPELILPPTDVIYSTVHPSILATALDRIVTGAAQRLVCFTSTSIVTKFDSSIQIEREGVRELAEGELRLRRACEARNLDCTVLRPTIIYAEGLDANLTRVAKFIKRFGFFPIAGKGNGLRQPVHAEDLAIGAIAASSSPRTSNKTYVLPGKDVLTYREMVGRIFDSLDQPRIIVPIPPRIWVLAFRVFSPFFPKANSAMGIRMSKDMVFDGTPAVEDFGWNPRPFNPLFRKTAYSREDDLVSQARES